MKEKLKRMERKGYQLRVNVNSRTTLLNLIGLRQMRFWQRWNMTSQHEVKINNEFD